ncbi:alpha/beta hydrolase [Brevundimonas nasdae]|uniref:alpha/beta hydrolase n=1 Tax=Brevundimonas nasdae TaxID=172043 RepID=UPI001FD4EFD9|nr:alpha/beta hydrolase [Brevundimonas nasdae]
MRRVAHDLPYGEDPRQRLDLYAPRGARGLPVLVFLGKPGVHDQYEPTALALAARGFVVALPDYPVTRPPLFPAQIADAALAMAQAARLAADHGGDPTRLGVIGHGAGAGLAMMITLDRRYMAAVDQPNLIRAAAGLAGVYGAAQTTDPTWTQPIAYVRPNAPPIWLGYGADDNTVAAADTVTLHQRLRDSGGRSEIKLYPGLDHAGIIEAFLLSDRPEASAWDEVAGFFRRHLQ